MNVSSTNLAPALRHGACPGRVCLYIAAAEEAVDRRCRRKPRGETLAACIPIPFDERWVLSRHHRRQKGLPLAFASRSPYHEGVRFLRYKLRSTLARHEKRTSAKGRQPIRPLAAVFNVCPSRNAIRRSSENITNAYAYKGRQAYLAPSRARRSSRPGAGRPRRPGYQ